MDGQTLGGLQAVGKGDLRDLLYFGLARGFLGYFDPVGQCGKCVDKVVDKYLFLLKTMMKKPRIDFLSEVGIGAIQKGGAMKIYGSIFCSLTLIAAACSTTAETDALVAELNSAVECSMAGDFDSDGRVESMRVAVQTHDNEFVCKSKGPKPSVLPTALAYADADRDGDGEKESGSYEFCVDEWQRGHATRIVCIENHGVTYHSFLAVDCDDHDPGRSSTHAEICDGVDNDCDGEVDEDLTCPIHLAARELNSH